MDSERHRLFCAAFIQTQHQIYRYCLGLVVHATEAEELLQRTGITLWERWEEYDPQRPFLSWALGIAHNHVRNHIRMRIRAGRQVVLDDAVLDTLATTFETHEPTLAHQRQAVQACLERLPMKQRELLERHYAHEQPIEQVANEVAMSVEAVYKAVARTRRNLYECAQRALRQAEDGNAFVP